MDKHIEKCDIHVFFFTGILNVFFEPSLFLSLGVHQLLHYHLSSQQSQHTLCSGLHQRHTGRTILTCSQKRSCHPDRKPLHLPGTPAAEEERITYWYVLIWSFMRFVQSKDEVLTNNVPYLFPEAISPSLNLNLVFVAGCVIAVVAMVCGMMVYKSRGSKVNYQLVKSDEI